MPGAKQYRPQTVGCAPCDRGMYEAIGFRVPLGTLLAWSDGNT